MNFISFKMQIMCLILLIYLVFMYIHNHSNKDKMRTVIYSLMLVTACIYLPLDIGTVYTVNHIDIVNPLLNRTIHALFFISILSYLLLSFLYVARLCKIDFSSKLTIAVSFLPYAVSFVLIIANIGNLEWHIGRYTNYSMGYSVYACYGVGFVYFVAGIVIFIRRMRYIPKHKQKMLLFSNAVTLATMIAQMIFPELLATSSALMLIILSYYISIENGSYESSDNQQNDMIHGLADIVESRDASTGGHIKRTAEYTALLVEKLRNTPQYRYILTQDYIDALITAAPLHDIGKISIPDSILRKAGKLTEEEYAIMKTHTTEGARLVEKSLVISSSLRKNIIYETVCCHHEKWNGKGYPAGKCGEEIPLCARIMAVVDVFDAVSQNRCYRAAMTLDESFEIIKKGIGTDFDPVIASCFLENREDIERMHKQLYC